MFFLRDLILIRIFMGFIGLFYSSIIINSIVIIWQLAPKGKVGALTGVYYLFSHLSATFSPVLAGVVFSLYEFLTDVDDGFQYIMLFPFAILCEIAAFFCLRHVKRGETKTFTTKQITKLRNEQENC